MTMPMPAEPVYPEIEALRRALAQFDEWPPETPGVIGEVISAARVVLAVFDEQQAKYRAALMATHITDEQVRALLKSMPVTVVCCCPGASYPDDPNAVSEYCSVHNWQPRERR